MYRKSQAMASEAETPQHTDPQFLQRVGSLPIVESTLGQLASIYQHTKDSNRYIKYTLETAEAGVKTVAHTAVPVVVNKLERPIGAIDSVACSQLDKLEEKYPLITKPTDEVVCESKKVYDAKLKPTVDTVTGVTQTSIDKVGAAKQYTVDTISATKQYTVDTVNSVKDYTTSTVNNTVSGVKNYTYNTVAATASYGKDKLDTALETSTGQTVISKVDQLLEKTEQYVDYYLPEQKKEGEEETKETPMDTESEDTTVCPAGANKPTDITFGKLVTVSDKVRRRMYAKSMKDLQNVQKRSKETLERLNFTVDLIEYAKANLDGAKSRASSVKTKFQDVWEEINREEGENIEMSDMAAEEGEKNGETETTDNAEKQVSNATLEKRAIAVARNLTSKLKSSFHTMMNTGAFLPATLQTQISGAKTYTENLYSSFTNAKTLNDVPTTLLTQTRTQVTHLQETLTSYTEYIRNNYLTNWMGSSSPQTEEAVSPSGETPSGETPSSESISAKSESLQDMDTTDTSPVQDSSHDTEVKAPSAEHTDASSPNVGEGEKHEQNQ